MLLVLFFFNGAQDLIRQPEGEKFILRLIEECGQGRNILLPEEPVSAFHFAEKSGIDVQLGRQMAEEDVALLPELSDSITNHG